MADLNDVAEWYTGRDFDKQYDLYVNYEKVAALETTLNDIKTNEVTAARKATQDAVDEINNINGMAEYVGQLNSYDELYDNIDSLIDEVVTTVDTVAENIKIYEQAYEETGGWENVGSTFVSGAVKLGEGGLGIIETIGDGVAVGLSWVTSLGGTHENAVSESLKEGAEDDWSSGVFDAYWDTDFAKKSSLTRDSAAAGCLEICGSILVFCGATEALTPVAGTAMGGSGATAAKATINIGKATVSANTVAGTAVAASSGFGSGAVKSLKNGGSINDAMIAGTIKGTTEGALAFGIGTAADTFSASRAAKALSNETGEATKATQDAVEEINNIKNSDDAIDDLIQKQKELDKAYKSGKYSETQLGELEEARDAAKKAVTDIGENADDIINKTSNLTKAEDTFNSAEKALDDAYKSGKYSESELGELEEARDAAKKAYESAKNSLESTDDIVNKTTQSTKSTTDAAKNGDDVFEDTVEDIDDENVRNAVKEHAQETGANEGGAEPVEEVDARSLKQKIHDAPSDIKNSVKNTVNEVKSTVKGKVASVSEKVNNAKAAAAETFTNVKNTAGEVVTKIATSPVTEKIVTSPVVQDGVKVGIAAANTNLDSGNSSTQFKSVAVNTGTQASEGKTPADIDRIPEFINDGKTSGDQDGTPPTDTDTDYTGYVPSGGGTPSGVTTTTTDTGSTNSSEQFQELTGTIQETHDEKAIDIKEDLITPTIEDPTPTEPINPNTPTDDTPTDDTPTVVVPATPTDDTPTVVVNNPTDGGGTTTTTGGGYSRSGGYTASSNEGTTSTTPTEGIKSSVRDIDEIIRGNNKTYKQIPKSSSVITKKPTGSAGSSVIPIAAGLSAAAAAGIGAKAYIDRKKNNDNGEDEDDFDTEEWSENGNLDIDYNDDSDTKVEENLIDEDNDTYTDDDYAYQEVEEEKYGARNNEELADLQ